MLWQRFRDNTEEITAPLVTAQPPRTGLPAALLMSQAIMLPEVSIRISCLHKMIESHNHSNQLKPTLF